MKIIKKNIIPTILFVIIIAATSTPLVQQEFQFAKVKRLNGYSHKVLKPRITQKRWFLQIYQKDLEKYLNQNFGFRPFFVRLNNQLNFSLYHDSKNKKIILGKENYIFEKNYVSEYTGENYIGDSAVKSKVKKLAEINEYLRNNDIDFVIIFAPGKASFFSEQLPEQYTKNKFGKSNYESYVEEIAQTNIPFIDLKVWIESIRDTFPYPLFPMTGSHWSNYTEFIVLDSLSSYIESTCNCILPKVIIDSTYTSDVPLKRDNDCELALNLFFPIKSNSLTYPYIHIENNNDTPNINILSISDSYYYYLHDNFFGKKIYNKSEFWYYFEQVISKKTPEYSSVNDFNLKEEIMKKDLIFLMCTDGNLYKFPYGFDFKFHRIMNKSVEEINQDRERIIKKFTKEIKRNPKHLDKLKIKAKDRGISLEQAIKNDAVYMYNNPKKFPPE